MSLSDVGREVTPSVLNKHLSKVDYIFFQF